MSNMRGGGEGGGGHGGWRGGGGGDDDDSNTRGGRGGGMENAVEAMENFRAMEQQQRQQAFQQMQQPQQGRGFGGERGRWRAIGGENEWRGTRAMVAWNGKLYASHSNGKVFGIDPASGQWQQIGTSSGWNTRLMFALADMLVLIEQSGTAWALDPVRGGHLQVGKDGEWKNIDAGDWTDQHVFCHSTEGTLWKWSTPDRWEQIGNSNGWKSRFVFAGHGLVTIEQDRRMFRVDPNGGQYQDLGRTQNEIRAGVGYHGHIYACFDDGGLYDFDIESGQWSPVGNQKSWASQQIVAFGSGVITLEERGSLFEVTV
jgi:hypothetical protein